MPHFKTQPVLKEKKNEPFHVISNGSPTEMPWGTASLDEVAKLDPRITRAQQFCFESLPSGANMKWFGIAYDDFGNHIRIVMGADLSNHDLCHLWVLNDPDARSGELSIAEHHTGHPLEIISLANKIGLRYMQR